MRLCTPLHQKNTKQKPEIHLKPSCINMHLSCENIFMQIRLIVLACLVDFITLRLENQPA
jgi:hypothetical protein